MANEFATQFELWQHSVAESHLVPFWLSPQGGQSGLGNQKTRDRRAKRQNKQKREAEAKQVESWKPSVAGLAHHDPRQGPLAALCGSVSVEDQGRHVMEKAPLRHVRLGDDFPFRVWNFNPMFHRSPNNWV